MTWACARWWHTVYTAAMRGRRRGSPAPTGAASSGAASNDCNARRRVTCMEDPRIEFAHSLANRLDQLVHRVGDSLLDVAGPAQRRPAVFVQVRPALVAAFEPNATRRDVRDHVIG